MIGFGWVTLTAGWLIDAGTMGEPLFTGGSAGVIAVLVMVPFLFVGFDVIPQSAEKAPERRQGSDARIRSPEAP